MGVADFSEEDFPFEGGRSPAAVPAVVHPINDHIPPPWLDEAPPIGETAPRRPPIKATPYNCKDPTELPRRPWIYGRQLLRGSLSVVVSPGAVGKTALMVGTALALATGRALLDKQVWGGPKRVWLWNLEDSELELSYLIEAARKHWSIGGGDLAERLFVDSALSGAELCVATEDHTGFRILEPVIEELVDELLAREIDVLIVDPFVSSHSVSENNNSAIDAVAKKWARVGVRANCAVVMVHHTRKLNGQEVTAEGGRGAVALPNASRSVVALNRMTPEEASKWGVEGEDRRRFFRAYDDKNNRTPPAEQSDWYQLASIDLGNAANGERGDSIQVVLPWTPPDAFSGLTSDDLRRVQEAIAAGDYRESIQSPDWAGRAVAAALALDADDAKDKARIKALLRGWLETEALLRVEAKDKKGNLRPFIRVGRPVEPDGSTP